MKTQTDAGSPFSSADSATATRRVVEAIRTRSLCRDCLRIATGLSDLVVGSSLLTASRARRFDTWTPCRSCGAVEGTYRLIGEVSEPHATPP